MYDIINKNIISERVKIIMTNDFENLKRNEQSEILKPEIIRVLRDLGGQASRKEIRNELKTSSDKIPEEYIDFRKEGKNGQLFSPFLFPFNFAIKEFEVANFITMPKRGYVKLTEKGRTFDIEDKESLLSEISKFAAPYWEEKNKKRQKSKMKLEDENNEIDQRDIDNLEDEIMTESWKNDLRTALDQMSPQKFETFSRALVTKMGVDIDEKIGIQFVADGGLDGFGYITADDFRSSRVAIQAKRWTESVPSPEIDKFRGAMDKHNAEFGIFITTSVFSRPAIKASREGTRVITLIDGEKIADLVERYELYVNKVETYKLDDFFFDED